MVNCEKCKKELLIFYECRCGGKFCIKHKDDIKHNCKFDYIKDNKEKLNSKKVTFPKHDFL